MNLLATRLRCTEGQAYTLMVGFVLVGVMVLSGVPAAMRERIAQAGPVAPPEAAAAPVASGGAAATPTPTVNGATPSNPGAASSPTAHAPSSAATPTAAGPAPPGTGAGSAPKPFGTVTTFATVRDPGVPTDIALGGDGTVYASTGNGTHQGLSGPSQVIAFDASGAVVRTYTVAGQSDGHADGVTGLALDGHGGLVALDAGSSPPRVLRFDLDSGTQSTLAVVPDIPACLTVVASNCEPGIQDHRPAPHAAAFDGLGNLYVTDSGQATIWKIPTSGGNPSPWYQSMDFAIGDGPAGLLVDGAGDVVFTVGLTLDAANLGQGGVYRLPVSGSGSAGTRVLVAKFAQADAPDGIVLGASGRIYVALRGANAVAVLGPDGAEQHRVTSSELDAPTGLAFRGTSVLVANQSPVNKKWAVLDVAVEDTGAGVYGA